MFLVNFRTLAIAALSVAVVLAIFPSHAGAQRFDKGTTITINKAFEIPGTTLPPGEYVIRLLEVAGNRNVVQILSSDEKKSHAIVLAIPDYRLEAPEKTAISFYEVNPGAPLPLHAWFYPGSNFGVEFVYPKRKAIEIARESGEHVIAITVEPLEEPSPAELESAPIVAIEPGGAEVEVATIHPASPEPTLLAEAPEVVREKPSLPKTATPFPLISVIGLLAAGAAAVLRVVMKS
jgi:hypothetical protein